MTEPSAEFLAKRIGLSHLGPADLRVLLADTSRAFASWRTNWLSSARLRGSLFSDCVRWPQPLAEKIDGDRSCIWRRNPGARSTCNAAATGSLQSTAANADLVMTPAEQAREKIEALKQSPEFLKAWHARDPAALRKLQQLQLEEHQHLQA
jgi:hypothetical protein